MINSASLAQQITSIIGVRAGLRFWRFGNRTNSHRSAAYGYQPNNRLTSTDSASYLYDINGNMTAKSDGAGTTQLQWDFEDRLTNVVTPSAGVVTYKYDALGRRIQRAPSNGVSTNFSYDGPDVVRDKNSDKPCTGNKSDGQADRGNELFCDSCFRRM